MDAYPHWDPTTRTVSMDRYDPGGDAVVQLARDARRAAGYDPDADPEISTLTSDELDSLGRSLAAEILAAERGETLPDDQRFETALKQLLAGRVH
jgi:hypothetical protein